MAIKVQKISKVSYVIKDTKDKASRIHVSVFGGGLYVKQDSDTLSLLKRDVDPLIKLLKKLKKEI